VLASPLLGVGSGQTDAPALWLAVAGTGDAVLVDGIDRLAGDLAYSNDAFHCARMRELREAGNDIADGIDAGLGGLHPFVHLDEAALRLDLGLLQTDVFRTRRPPDRDKNFFRFDGLALALAIGEGDFDAVFGLL